MQPVLEVKNLTFGYDEKLILKDYYLEVYPGEILCIEGENGAGKTTLLNCITGIINMYQSICLKGLPLSENKHLIKNISYIMSEDSLYDYLTVQENINFFKTIFQCSHEYDNRIREYLRILSIDEYKHVLAKNLSQGMRNKLYLSIMLSRDFDILILDEPFTALDRKTQEVVLETTTRLAKENKKSILFVTHINEFKSIATRIVNVKKVNDKFVDFKTLKQ